MMGIKSAVEAYHVFQILALKSLDNLFDLRQIMVDGFLAENVLAGVDRLDRDRGMCIGRGADQDCVDLRIIQDLLVICGGVLYAHALSPCSGLFIHEGICDCLDHAVADACADAGDVQLADSAGTDDTYFNHG